MKKSVVITGMGLVTPLGMGVSNVWDRVIKSLSGITCVTDSDHFRAFDTDSLPSLVAGFVPDRQSVLDAHIRPKDQRKMGQFIVWAMIAAAEALKDAGWSPKTEDQKCRTGVSVGSGIGGLPEIEQWSVSLKEKGRVGPFFVPSSLINLASGNIAIQHECKGPNMSIVTACSSGAHSIGEAKRIIMDDQADVMIAGGCEAAICPLGMRGFSAMNALSTHFNDRPEKASRPWDKDRDGFVIAEGAGIVVLESLEHALHRGAPIYGILSGYGLSCDAHHIAAPDTNGNGAYRCMQMALKNAGLSPEEIGYINAHSTSTPAGDLAELQALAKIFPAKTPVSSTKGSIGHLLGAAGSVEAIFSLMALKNNLLPPTLNLDQPEQTSLDLIAHTARPVDNLEHVLSNSFGFGGANATLIFSKYPRTSS